MQYLGPHELKPGDQYYKPVAFTKQTTAGVAVAFLIPSRASIHFYNDTDKTTLLKKLDSADVEKDGDIAITVNGSGFILTLNIEGVDTEDLEVGTMMYGDIQMEWASEKPSPWTPCNIRVKIVQQYTDI